MNKLININKLSRTFSGRTYGKAPVRTKVSDDTQYILKSASPDSEKTCPTPCDDCHGCGCDGNCGTPGCTCEASVEIPDIVRGAEAKAIIERCAAAGFDVYIDPAEEGLAWEIKSDDEDNFIICRYQDEMGRVVRRQLEA